MLYARMLDNSFINMVQGNPQIFSLWEELRPARFKINCCCDMDADINAAKNIALLGAVVNQPEKSGMLSCALHTSA